jgi:nucleoside-diphosphate-sugar epimerase
MPLTHGQQTRDLVYVDDVAAAIVAAVEAPATPRGTEILDAGGGQVFNIASGVETRIQDVCLGIARALGADPALLGFGETPLRPDEAHRYVMDVSRAAERLGWRATTSLADGFARL